jgi:hypothetical protein
VGLASVVARALKRHPDHRPTAPELLALLTELCDREPPTEQRPPLGMSEAVSEGEPTHRMSKPPETHGIDDATTDESPRIQSGSLPTPRIPTASVRSPKLRPEAATTMQSESARSVFGPHSVDLAMELDAASIHETRPTAHSPILAPKYEQPAITLTHEVAAPQTVPSTTLNEPSASRGERVIPLRLALFGLIAALLLGVVIGLSVHEVMAPRPARQHSPAP